VVPFSFHFVATTPPELIEQMKYMSAFNDAFGLKEFRASGYEADDCIGALTTLVCIHDPNISYPLTRFVLD
jgi:5'-3' exonuclease